VFTGGIMKIKEPKFMQDLHRIREQIGKRYRALSKDRLLRALAIRKLNKVKLKAA